MAHYHTKMQQVAVDPKILKWGGGGKQCIGPSSFIANAHNELYAFYTGKLAAY